MIFSYWDGDQAEIGDFAAARDAVGLPVRVYGKQDVLETLRLYRPDAVPMIDDITIPACLSDLGRLLLLYRHGGLYVDTHAGAPDVLAIAHVFAKLAVSEVVAFIIPPRTGSMVTGQMVNGALCARAGSSLIKALIDAVLANLAAHRAAERNSVEPPPYNLTVVSGAWVPRRLWFSPESKDLILNEDLIGRIAFVRVHADHPPFVFYRHYGYRAPGRHWSERQKCERLFRVRAKARSTGPVHLVGFGGVTPSS